MVRYSDVKKNIIGQVGLRLCNDQKRSKGDPSCVKPMDSSLPEHSNEEESGETLGNDECDLHAIKCKGKGFKEQCFHCGQYGHRVAECRKKDIDMMKERERTKGSAKERTHHSSRC